MMTLPQSLIVIEEAFDFLKKKKEFKKKTVIIVFCIGTSIDKLAIHIFIIGIEDLFK